MKKQAAQKLIQETLQKSFDKERFVYFVKNILNDFEEYPLDHQRISISKDFADSVHHLEYVGKYQGPDEKYIDILIAHLARDTSLDRARTKQRNFVAKYLRSSRESVLKDAALVAFVAPNSEDWRFSLVKMEYKFDDKGKVKEVFTPARRYSFLVGKNENSHTAQSRLLPVLVNEKINPTLEKLEEAFSVEPVTKEFFEKYRDLFLRIKDSLDDVVKKNASVSADFKRKNIDTADFSKKLLGQIVFLYFLQKKGWFGIARDEEWGSGSRYFLRELFEKKHSEYNNFFNDILEAFFYEALSKKNNDKNYYSPFNCRIPFLNGGLFDPLNDYDWKDTDVLLPNDIFSNDRRTKEGDIGDGVLDIFDRYNFTVKEDEPLEREVAVDPEMLGKVFENLLEVKDRKSKGTYYTPREIVHYMCQESLANYLATELNGKISKDDIETLIKYGEDAMEHDDFDAGTGHCEANRYSFRLPQSIVQHAKTIDEKLGSIRICDPAVGSGAFPVGMMNEIVRARNALTTCIGKMATRTSYNFKRQAIQDCLYGVDIDPGAVEIAKLRLWLSLVVDEEEREQIQPLPNLDYKIVQGNSLLSVKKQLFNTDQFKKLEELKPLYFNEISSGKKQKHRHQIDKIIGELTNDRKNFDFEVYFSEVFHEKKGFDVVIANPPYVSYGLRGGQKMTKEEKIFLRKTFPNSAEYKISLYAIFMDRGFQISKPNGGIETYIVPDSFLLGRYFSKIRKFILQNSEIINILLLPFGVFKATVGFSVIYLIQRKKEVNSDHQITSRFGAKLQTVASAVFNELTYPQKLFHIVKYNRFRLFFDKNIMNLVSKIETNSDELNNFLTGHTGIRSLIGQKNIIADEKKGVTWKPGLISGSKVKKYKIIDDGYFINIDPKQLNKGGWNYDIIHNPKMLVRQTSDSLIASMDNSGFYHLNNIHSFSPNAKNKDRLDILYILAIFNSKLLDFYYKNISLETGRTMAQTDIETLESLPIKSVSRDEQKPVIDLVDKILIVTKDNDYLESISKQAKVHEYEKQIDQIVYKLYGLTTEEIKVIEGNDTRS